MPLGALSGIGSLLKKHDGHLPPPPPPKPMCFCNAPPPPKPKRDCKTLFQKAKDLWNKTPPPGKVPEMDPEEEAQLTKLLAEYEQEPESFADDREESAEIQLNAQGEEERHIAEEESFVVDEDGMKVKVKLVRLTRDKYNRMLKHLEVQPERINHLTVPENPNEILEIDSDDSNNPLADWKDVPLPMIKKMVKVANKGTSKSCHKSCPCKYTQELIRMYHLMQSLITKAKTINKSTGHCQIKMTNSETEFFHEDTTLCSVMLGELRNQRAEIREVEDMYQEAKEKFHKEEEALRDVEATVHAAERTVLEAKATMADWLPGGRMVQLREEQRAIEDEMQKKIESMHENKRDLMKDKVQKRLERKEKWRAEDRARDTKRTRQRQKDMLTLLRATTLMQKFISDNKDKGLF